MKTKNTLLSFSKITERTSVFTMLGWIMVFALALYYTYTNALRYFDFSNPVYTPAPLGSKPFALFLATHVAGGVIALLIGPFQFFSLIRKKYVRIHRNIGKAYLVCISLSGMAATYLAIFHNLLIKQEFIFGVGALAMSFAWFLTTGMAIWAIKYRNFLQHQEWMIRSYVLTCNFILFRLMFYGLLGIEDFPYKNEVGALTVWASWSIPLLVTEAIMQAKKIQASSKKLRKQQIA